MANVDPHKVLTNLAQQVAELTLAKAISDVALDDALAQVAAYEQAERDNAAAAQGASS